MAESIINVASVRELLDYCETTGAFTWRMNRGKAKAGTTAGHLGKNGYRRIWIGGRQCRAHRLAWLLVYGRWPEGEIDHINGARDDNRIANLRDVVKTLNQQNQRLPSKNNTSGYLGVSRHKTKWCAQISVNNRGVWLGCFDTAVAAADAYLNAKRQFHSACTI